MTYAPQTPGARHRLGTRLAVSTALGYLARHRTRTAAAVVAAALGAGILGASTTLTNSAHAAVTQEFLNLKSSRLTASSISARPGWISDAQLALTRELPGVREVCSMTSASGLVPIRKSLLSSTDYQVPVHAVDIGCAVAMNLVTIHGRDFAALDRSASTPVVLLGSAVADNLGLTTLTGNDRIYLDAAPYTVIGILSPTVDADAARSLSVFLPAPNTSLSITTWDNTEVIVDTEPAATDAVAAVLAESLQPADPADVYVLAGAIPTGLQSAVSNQITLLLIVLGGLSIIIGLFVIGNQTLQSVGLRRSEIALRRALGQPRHVVVTQVLTETILCGAAGGFIGATLGQLTAALIAISQGWPALTQIELVPLSTVGGAAIGAIAGVYPAHVASTTDPAQVLKTG